MIRGAQVALAAELGTSRQRVSQLALTGMDDAQIRAYHALSRAERVWFTKGFVRGRDFAEREQVHDAFVGRVTRTGKRVSDMWWSINGRIVVWTRGHEHGCCPMSRLDAEGWR